MKLAVSSLAWDPAQDDVVRALLGRLDVRGIEVAPLKYWPDPAGAAGSDLAEFRERWNGEGISIVALQGILFGHPDLELFGSPDQQLRLERHLAAITRIAASLGASCAVFGAPANRRRGALDHDAAIERAAPLMRRVAQAAADGGTVIGLEPNPQRYGGDFVRNVAEALQLVDAVGHPGLALHLDAGAAVVAGESDETLVAAAARAAHFHISEVDLVPLGDGTVDHERLGRLLERGKYGLWASIEMRPLGSPELAVTLERAVAVARNAYRTTLADR